MAAPDFYFVIQATFRHLHDAHGVDALHAYWREMGRDFQRERWERWRDLGSAELARDWRAFFAGEPGSSVVVKEDAGGSVTIDVDVCPAIAHLQASGRPVVDYFCDHCDHVCSAMAQPAGFAFERTGGMGRCRHRYVSLRVRAAGE